MKARKEKHYQGCTPTNNEHYKHLYKTGKKLALTELVIFGCIQQILLGATLWWDAMELPDVLDTNFALKKLAGN